MLTKIIYVLLSILLVLPSKAQNQDAQLLAYNSLFGGITAGIGSIINKQKKDNTWKVFKRGFLYGSIGGTVNYAGKKIAYNINATGKSWYGWPSKIIHSYGSSIIENAALNKPNVFASLRMPIGFVMLDVNAENKFKLNASIMPISFGRFVSQLSKYTIDVTTSLNTGVPIFKNSNLNSINTYASFNNISLSSNLYTLGADFKNYNLTHEFIHILQHREYMVFNTYVKKIDNNIKSKSKFYNFLNKVFTFDYNYTIPTQLFIKRNQFGANYFKNWYEFEAERFATNNYVPR